MLKVWVADYFVLELDPKLTAGQERASGGDTRMISRCPHQRSSIPQRHETKANPIRRGHEEVSQQQKPALLHHLAPLLPHRPYLLLDPQPNGLKRPSLPTGYNSSSEFGSRIPQYSEIP